MNIIQLLLIFFLWFALSRVILQFRQRQISPLLFTFWGVLFTSAILAVFLPEQTTKLAEFVGIGRGVDLMVYASIVVLFYLVFRAYILLEDIRHEITQAVREIALKDAQKRHQ